MAARRALAALPLALLSAISLAAGVESAPSTAGDGARYVAQPLDEPWLADRALQLAEVPGASQWLLFPYLWHERTVNVTCPAQKALLAYVARSRGQLRERVVRGQQSTWCSLSQWAGSAPGSCLVSVSPFGTTHLGIAHTRSRGYAGASPCTLEVRERLSPWLPLRGFLGAALFLAAGTLSHSLVFRLGTGSLGFVALSGIFLAVLLARSLPNKKAIAGVYLLLGSSATFAFEWLFGTWLPAFDELLISKAFLGYVVAAGLAGLALTYYFDNPANVKLLTIFDAGLRLLGLALTFSSTSRADVSAALCALLVAAAAAQHWAGDWMLSRAAEAVQAAAALSPAAKPRAKEAGTAGQAGLREAGDESPEGDDRPPGALAEKGEAKTSGLRGAAGSSATPTASLWRAHLQWRERQERQERRGRGKGRGKAAGLEEAGAAPLPGDEEEEEGGGGDGASRWQGGPCSSTTGPETPEPSAPGGESPLVQRGLVLNERTGKVIKIGAGTYNKLLLDGYELNRAAGVLTPPGGRSGGQDSPAASGGRSGRSQPRLRTS